jgi:mRNA-degrading endonuclease RelE of RelBE toxin-antitoxin system
MDELQKAIAKLAKEHRAVFDSLMVRLYERNFLGLDLAKLKGHKDVFRVKHGRLRIIFRMNREGLSVLEVGLRNENTYRNF